LRRSADRRHPHVLRDRVPRRHWTRCPWRERRQMEWSPERRRDSTARADAVPLGPQVPRCRRDHTAASAQTESREGSPATTRSKREAASTDMLVPSRERSRGSRRRARMVCPSDHRRSARARYVVIYVALSRADYRTSSARTSRRPSTTRSDQSASCSTICNPRPAGRRSSGESATTAELPRRIGSRTQMRTRRG
jgi:hypothetical protein